ncbi:ABC transporter permease [Stenotrophomonas sp. HITSZ_GD]|uniref:ABC transporter permease n=1 Tax=Stenotrophomonas sp. HITSZ_GD TaxID=3037248 RepID=UPI00240E0440|nr:ABC transporter permease [Stenotrophomonas sp. HITSZ_GD]MDG2526273.1 ABC transporter permease [Stenotrophomonas sp. HITSZ_GD]
MNRWIDCVRAEHAKLKRTFARGMAIAAPVCAVLLSLFVLANLDVLAASKGIARWEAYLDSLLRIWASFVLPIMATLQAVLIAQLEHGNRQWKYLLALPVSRASLYVAKSVNLFALLLLGHVVLWLAAMAACAAFGLAPDALGAAGGFLAGRLGGTFVAALVLAAVQLLVAVRLESFVAAIAVGLVATLVALLGASTLGHAAGYYPWSMPMHALQVPQAAWWIGVLAATVVVTALGAQWLRRMQVH